MICSICRESVDRLYPIEGQVSRCAGCFDDENFFICEDCGEKKSVEERDASVMEEFSTELCDDCVKDRRHDPDDSVGKFSRKEWSDGYHS